MAFTDLHVNGPARVDVALNGSTYSNFGYTEDGVEIRLRIFHDDIQTDDYGSSMPGDVQFMGAEARINLSMVRWDASVMNSVLALTRSATLGGFSTFDIGALMVAGNKYMGLRIASSTRTGGIAEPGHTFAYAWPVEEAAFKVGTRVTRHQFTFRGIYQNGTWLSRS